MPSVTLIISSSSEASPMRAHDRPRPDACRSRRRRHGPSAARVTPRTGSPGPARDQEHVVVTIGEAHVDQLVVPRSLTAIRPVRGSRTRAARSSSRCPCAWRTGGTARPCTPSASITAWTLSSADTATPGVRGVHPARRARSLGISCTLTRYTRPDVVKKSSQWCVVVVNTWLTTSSSLRFAPITARCRRAPAAGTRRRGASRSRRG